MQIRFSNMTVPKKRKQFPSLNFCYCLQVQQKWKGGRVSLKIKQSSRKRWMLRPQACGMHSLFFIDMNSDYRFRAI